MLSGRLNAISLFDLCQFLMLNRKSGTLAVRGDGGSAFLTFHEGQLLNAVDDALREGEAVVLAAVQWADGTFEFDVGPVPPDRRIHASTENILLEAARKIDEMAAARDGIDEDATRPKKQEEFLETQRRASALADAFRRAVHSGGRSGHDWKREVVETLATARASRALVGPGARLDLVTAEGVQSIPGLDPAEVAAWLEEIAPARVRRRGASRLDPVRRTRFGLEGWPLCAVRHRSSGGDWVSLAIPSVRFPVPEEIGLAEGEIPGRAPVPGLLAILATPEAGGLEVSALPAAALWLARRQAERPDVAWVIEDWPRYDWSRLPGRVEALTASAGIASGAIAGLVRATGTRRLVVAGPPIPPLLPEVLGAAIAGCEVAVADQSADPRRWLEALRRVSGPVALDMRGLCCRCWWIGGRAAGTDGRLFDLDDAA